MVGSGDRGRLRIASRGSALALWQANHVMERLVAIGRADVEVLVVRTTGDAVQDVPLSRIGDRGLFTREVDDALLDGRADLAVHSLKDVPTSLPAGLEIVAVLEREDPADALVCGPDLPGTLRDLPAGARVGTSSLRRRAQLAALRPDLEVVDLRGNVDTRLARVADGVVDATVLARAGLLRLGRAEEATQVLSSPEWLPAVGQGALALVMRSGEDRPGIATLDHAATRAATMAERSFLARLEGGCQVPIGALATVAAGVIELHGGVFSLDGRTQFRDGLSAPVEEAEPAGRELAERLLAAGADSVLSEIRADAPRPGVPAP